MSERALLVVKHRIPCPVEIGSDVVSSGLLSSVHRAFRVTLVTVDDGERARSGADELRSMGIEVILAPRDTRAVTQLTAAGAIARNARLVFGGMPRSLLSQSCRSLGPLLDSLTRDRRFALAHFEYWTTAPYRRFAHCQAALLNHDAWFRTVEAYARYEQSPIRKLLWRLEARAVRRQERAAQGSFDWRIFLSEDDRCEILAGRERSRSAVLPVPFPFQPQGPATLDVSRQAPRVLFIGAMDVPFNIDAACYFVERIWPAVRGTIPEAVFTIAGRRPTAPVLRLAERPGVRVAHDPDLDELLRTSQVSVSPARIGSGIKVKVAQAMAYGLPVVGTPIGLSGFASADCLLRAGDEQTFAGHVVRLLRDRPYRQSIGRACHTFYRDHLWTESAAPQVVSLYERMMDRREDLVEPDARPQPTASNAGSLR